MTTEDASGAGEPFIGELKYWRDVRGFSQSALAKEVGYTPSYVSKVESGHQRPSRSFADHADGVLHAGGALSRAFRDYETRRHASPVNLPDHQREPGTAAESPPSSLLVEHDDAELFYDGASYRATQRRRLLNASSDPVARYLIRISVDRYPGSPERSNQLYRANPRPGRRSASAPGSTASRSAGGSSMIATRSRSYGCCLRTSTAAIPSIPAKAPCSNTPTPSAMTSGARGSSAPFGFRHGG